MLACETYNMTSVRVKVRVTKMERQDEIIDMSYAVCAALLLSWKLVT